ncbi:N-acetyltransferase [Halobacteriales archaeon QS_9_67_15]|nr:MAG: N-acetyltransferase [Halobacteriales archaeon QS_9_67_15]
MDRDTVTGTLRRYEPRDRDAVWHLHRTALSEAGTDPTDVPDIDDLRDVRATYLDTGGEFLVCELERNEPSKRERGERGAKRLARPASDAARESIDGQTGDIVAMGGLAVSDGDGEIPPDAGELLRIAVHPDHQRAGYGSAIVVGLEDAARERGLDRVFLWTAQRQRSAVSFYRSRGYEGTGHRTEGEYELLRFEQALDGDPVTPGVGDE